MLNKFRIAKEKEINALKILEKENKLPTPYQNIRPSFTNSLKNKYPTAIIAEYKRASPSLGDINLNISPEEAVEKYFSAGAAAISILTESDYFKGDLDFLFRANTTGLPLLRKDFILSPLQIIATASTPASAVLLIVRMLNDHEFEELLKLCAEFKLEAVCEVFDLKDLERAKKFNAQIIQVNNRDLDRLKIDLETSSRLITHKENGELWISASGISTPEEYNKLISLGFDAALIGSALMKGNNLTATLSTLLR
ncbi:indole-3-glycerol-phosphate synthase [Desulfovibrio litoralis]|uniref:indole-3-glycerol-phosphate synthase n=1 Tax=Desulfovibrio litoralis DSM 11393 TaxID=1121455 RepID=A0A1M7RWN9_9BACT|nr:indole-3-glycerol-phosphate synthase [Desulfovibrio litoralis]SHN50596.1 indole-3-glycerol phosphate synthase [Desulfovibrio litoralis DSM 11393]